MKNLFDLNSFSGKIIDDESDLIPLMTSDDEEAINKEKLPKSLSILPLKNTVLFPGVVIPITATRNKSVKLIKASNKGDKLVGVVSQINHKVSDPKLEDINNIGTVAKILRVLQMPDGNLTIIIQGKKRFKIKKIISEKPFLKADIIEINEIKPQKNDKKYNATIDSIKDLALKIIDENPNIPSEASIAIKNIQSNSFLVNFVSSNMNISVSEKYKILQIDNHQNRAIECLRYMNVEFQKLSLKNDIQSKVRNDLDQQQREYFLNQQLKTIQEELGSSSNHKDIEEIKSKASVKKWNFEIKDHFEKELVKLQRINTQMAEYSVQRNYIDLLLDLPWNEFSRDNYKLDNALRILNKDHFGLKKVKERIIEQIAVLKLKGDMSAPILCFYGPPGVGKTSLGKSIAKALGREYVRISLGGLRDESEIRGHRKTYIGAMPGRIIQNLKKVKTSNPVFVLDEIDKLSVGSQGDPSSAMLEVLDPEQNISFHDNFLELGFDLSKILFIATANNINNIQPALLDRMELISISGYSLEEKVQIAKKYLIKKQKINHGLGMDTFELDNRVIETIIKSYTKESGVRSLEKKISKISRWVAKSIVKNEDYNSKIQIPDLNNILGIGLDQTISENNDISGVVNGLAWTQFGGEILFVESTMSKGKGNLSITGNLGKVMKESATISLEYLKSNSSFLGIENKVFLENNFHIHVPEGATPKDGPSAGVTILCSLVSLIKNKKVKSKLAMSGEITLRGKVLPVGGIKEKILAAKRANIKDIVLPLSNKKNVEEIEKKYIKGLRFKYVEKMIEVINFSLEK